MKIEFTLPADAIIPAMYFHQEDGGGGGLNDFFPSLLGSMLTAHPDARICADEECAALVNPTFITRAAKHVPWEHGRFAISTEPARCCPECGGQVVTHAEFEALHPTVGEAESGPSHSPTLRPAMSMTPEVAAIVARQDYLAGHIDIEETRAIMSGAKA